MILIFTLVIALDQIVIKEYLVLIQYNLAQ